MKTELSIEIDCPIERVFDYTNNNVAEWSATVVSDEVVQDKNNGDVGTTFRVVTEERGQRMEFDGEVVDWSPPHASRVLLKGKAFSIDAEYLFKTLDNGRTEVTQVSRVIPHGFLMTVIFKSAGWMFKGSGKRALQADFETLKCHLEADST